MSSRIFHTAVTLALAISGVAAQDGANRTQDAVPAMFEAARKLETIDGDLKGAIKQYETIVKTHGSDRAAVARALLRMGECYQKLGDQQAVSIFERIVREFADQNAAAAARTHLTARRIQTKVLRAVWTAPAAVSDGTVSADGKYVAFADPDTGDLAVRDLTNGRESRLTHIDEDRRGRDFVSDAAISVDGAMVAYSWYIDGSKNQLRVASRAGDERSLPRILIDSEDISYIKPFEWAPSRDWIAVQVKRIDGTAQIGMAAVDDGRFRALRSVDWRGTTRMSVSPDGTWILYDLPSGEGSRQRDVFVIASDGRQQYQLNAKSGYNVAVGWAPDGKAALFAAERSGTIGLFAVQVRDGKPQSDPELLEHEMGAFFDSLGVTQSGRLFYSKKISGINVFKASLDFGTGKLLSAPEQMTDSMIPNHPGVMWSPDGRYLAYPSSARGATTILIQSVENGQIREVAPRMSRFLFPRWSAEDFITFQGADLKGRQGIFGMDVKTGEVTLLAGGDSSGYLSWAATTPDGSQLVYTRNRSGKFTLVSRSLSTGQEQELFQGPATATAISSDGKLVAFRTGERGVSAIMTVPVSGGQPRVVAKAESSVTFGHLAEWLPDGRLLIVRGKDRKFDRLVAVSPESGAMVELPPALEPLGGFLRVHPDGRQVAYSAGEAAFELWTLENVLPSAPARSTRR